MPETPDFEQIAAYWCFTQETDDVSEADARRAELVTVLTSIWNARGAADLDAIHAASTYTRTQIDQAVHSVDR